ncbi:hypothetical protein B0H10DRAFT_2439499 [Mycena sp. CBHHK59/15]|nr:hypothetical protein B0H10DRAFT_2439499 [Mycena sp. CBHHK59/15]
MADARARSGGWRACMPAAVADARLILAQKRASLSTTSSFTTSFTTSSTTSPTTTLHTSLPRALAKEADEATKMRAKALPLLPPALRALLTHAPRARRDARGGARAARVRRVAVREQHQWRDTGGGVGRACGAREGGGARCKPVVGRRKSVVRPRALPLVGAGSDPPLYMHAALAVRVLALGIVWAAGAGAAPLASESSSGHCPLSFVGLAFRWGVARSTGRRRRSEQWRSTGPSAAIAARLALLDGGAYNGKARGGWGWERREGEVMEGMGAMRATGRGWRALVCGSAFLLSSIVSPRAFLPSLLRLPSSPPSSPLPGARPLLVRGPHPRVLYALGYLVSAVARPDLVGRKPKHKTLVLEGLGVVRRDNGRELNVPRWATAGDVRAVEAQMAQIEADLMYELVAVRVVFFLSLPSSLLSLASLAVSIMRSEFDGAERVRSITSSPPRTPANHPSLRLSTPSSHTRAHARSSAARASRSCTPSSRTPSSRTPWGAARARTCYRVAAALAAETGDAGGVGAARAGEVVLLVGLRVRKGAGAKMVMAEEEEVDVSDAELGRMGRVRLKNALTYATVCQDNHLRAVIFALIAAHFVHTEGAQAQTMLATCEQLAAGLGAPGKKGRERADAVGLAIRVFVINPLNTLLVITAHCNPSTLNPLSFAFSVDATCLVRVPRRPAEYPRHRASQVSASRKCAKVQSESDNAVQTLSCGVPLMSLIIISRSRGFGGTRNLAE